jgi:hypothetical protein
LPRLGELLYWMVCWIAAIGAILGINALVQGGDTQSVVGVIAFFVTAGIIWLIGRAVLLMSRNK